MTFAPSRQRVLSPAQIEQARRAALRAQGLSTSTADFRARLCDLTKSEVLSHWQDLAERAQNQVPH